MSESDKKHQDAKRQQVENTIERNTLKCRTCHLSIDPRNFKCACSGNEDQKENKKENKNASKRSGSANPLDPMVRTLSTGTIASQYQYGSNAQSNDRAFNADVIAKLLSKDSLLIVIEGFELTLKCNPHLSKADRKKFEEELKKFVRAIKQEFEEFIKENNIPVNNCIAHIEKDDNHNITGLSVRMSSPELLAQFTQRLNANVGNFFHKSNAKQQETKPFNPSPLSTAFKPKGW